MAAPERPHRRWEATIRISADSMDDVKEALAEVERAIFEKPRAGTVDIVCGGPSYGYIVEATERPDVTHDSYFKALDAYQAWRRESGKVEP